MDPIDLTSNLKSLSYYATRLTRLKPKVFTARALNALVVLSMLVPTAGFSSMPNSADIPPENESDFVETTFIEGSHYLAPIYEHPEHRRRGGLHAGPGLLPIPSRPWRRAVLERDR